MLIEPGITKLSEIAVESFTRHELNDIFGAREVIISSKSYTLIPNNRGGQALISSEGEIRSAYHDLIGE